MIEMIMCDGSNDVGLVAIRWADKTKHLVPRINAEHAYRPLKGQSFPFGKDIFKAICSSEIDTSVTKEAYCITSSDLTIIFTIGDLGDIKNNKIKYRHCVYLNKEALVIDLHSCDIVDIGMTVQLLQKLDIKILNITGEKNLTRYEIKLLQEILTLIYKMLNKETIHYDNYEMSKR